MSGELDYLDEIYKKRKKYTDAVQENEFEEGILSLLSDLYPDEAHFVFELLQNAEDAGASKIVFELNTDHLRVTHNGKRLFNKKDVEGITSIAKSPKKDDVNKIGKFGIGFKAVFSYTQTPRIYSGGFSFEIRDLVCPNPISPIKKGTQDTVFVFPFNNPDKNAKACIEEVKSVFKKADETLLLFLNNIQIIRWRILGDKYFEGMIQRINLDKNLIEIKRKNGESAKTSCFLKYQKKLPNHGNLKCGVAFHVEREKEKLKVLPIKNGKLCIFFPAEKEHTGLRFHINGPYASSIDRASIKYEDKGNLEILKTTSALLIDGLKDIKKRGLLGLDILEILPNGDDDLHDFFSEIRDHLIGSFMSEPLVPTRDGKFYPASELVYGPKLMTDVFSNEQMCFLRGHEGKKWAIGAIKNSRAHKLLSSLDIPTWDEEALLHDMEKCLGGSYWYWRHDRNEEGKEWIKEQKDEWLVQFYLFLRRTLKKFDKEKYVIRWRIIRGENDHYCGKDIYYEPDEDSGSYDLPTIKKSLFIGLSPERKKNLNEFFGWAGVCEIGDKEAIENILSKHYPFSGPVIVAKTTHINHMRRFVKWYRDKGDVKIFDQRPILRTNNPDDIRCYFKSKLFLDEPFIKTNLTYLYDNPRSPLHQVKWLPWSEYKTIRGFSDFAIAFGVLKSLEIKCIRASIRAGKGRRFGGLLEFFYERKSDYCVDKDYDIDELDELLKNPDVRVSQLIWETMSEANEDVLKARYRPNRSTPIRSETSILVEKLRRYEWIPTKSGEFKKPRDVGKKLIAKGFNIDDATGWLDAIRFGEKEKAESQQEVEKLAKLRSLGLNKELYEMAMRMKGDPDLLAEIHEALKKKANKPDFPERPSPNPGRRAKKAKGSIIDAPDVERQQKKRNVRTSSSNVDKRAYLLEKYTNEEGQMVCQVCKEEMPFKLPSGGYYFEAVETVKQGSKEHASNFLALCPLCAAKYKEWVKKIPDAIELFGERALEQEDLDVPIEMDHKPYTVSFVEQHLIDFKAYLEEAAN